jgi:hypothetical protein
LSAGAAHPTLRPMVQIAIRCQPRVPVAAEELERWLELEVDELRKAAPHGTVRLSSLTQGAPTTNVDVGWLVELEFDEGEPLLAEHRLADALSDMRLLGLQPTLLTPRDGWANDQRGTRGGAA